jgi:hypothetical protein
VSEDFRESVDVGEFLSRRMLAHQRLDRYRCWGMSSDALALFGVGGGPRPRVPGRPTEPGRTLWNGEECGKGYPMDTSDLLACERTYAMAPAGAKPRMLPVLEEFRAWVYEGRNRYGEVVMPRRPHSQSQDQREVTG